MYCSETSFKSEIGDSKRRRLIVDLEAPSFTDKSLVEYVQQDLNITGCSFTDINLQLTMVNDDQRNAILKAINTKDYCLIQGMPGTSLSILIMMLRLTNIKLIYWDENFTKARVKVPLSPC